MPCEVSFGPDGLPAFVCTRGNRRPCDVEGCGRSHTRLCDFPLGRRLTFGEGVATCDMRLCDVHATRVSRDQDYCPDHAATLGVR